MRKLALLLAVLALAAMPSVADAAKKGKKEAAKPKAAPAAQKAAPEPAIVAFFRVGTSARHPDPAAKGKTAAKKGKK